MSKRGRETVDDSARPPKRTKSEHIQPVAVTEIEYASQLQDILIFRQDSVQQLRNGIASFKAFLESILYRRDEDNRPRQLSILREYLESQKPVDIKDTDRPFLSQLWQAWSFAVQNHSEHISSAVSAILTLLLRTLSGILDLRDHGLLLCRTVLQHQHLKLVKRGLDAPKHKDFIISPCCRLLTEVVNFDGGTLAREVYKRREQTLDLVVTRRNLGLAKQDISEEEAKRRPAIRTLTIRYIMGLLQFLNQGAKNDLLKNRPLCVAIFQYLRLDPAGLVLEILSVTEQHVLKDDELPRSTKGTLLTQHNLERVTEIATRLHDEHAACEKAFRWLINAITISSYGVFRECGWYPPGSDKVDSHHIAEQNSIKLGLVGLDFYNNADRPAVRNTTLLGWLQTLRPQTDMRERELVVTCFRSAPELVAAYFAEKNMQLDPKLSNTWIGYASFLFDVIRLPLPVAFGHVGSESYAQLPPQSVIVLENVLPRPLTQKVLTRCINQSSELITFFAIRILVLAMQKLATIQRHLKLAAELSGSHADLWAEAASLLQAQFVQRCPSMKDMIATFRKVPDDDEHVLQREAITHALRLYYEVAPLSAREENFDVSTTLSAALTKGNIDERIRHIRASELSHLLTIAEYSFGMRWLNRQGALQYSPLVTLLKLHVRDIQNAQFRRLINHVFHTSSIMSSSYAIEALLASLLEVGDSPQVWQFLDDCIARASRSPVKYVDELEQLMDRPKDTLVQHELNNLLAAVVIEQMPFVSKRQETLNWINMFLAALRCVKDCPLIFEKLHAKACNLQDFEPLMQPDACVAALERVAIRYHEQQATTAKDAQEVDGRSVLTFASPPAEQDDHPELIRWARKEIETAIEDGDVDALILCLSSQHDDVRRQAIIQLRLLRKNLQGSALDDRDSLSVLVGEVIETFEQQCLLDDHPLPYIIATFAVRAIHALIEPSHFLYPKLNRFLIKAPEWQIRKLPGYWLSNTVGSLSDEIDGYWKEIQWVLDWLVDGLRLQSDLEILRQGNIFERVLALYNSPGASTKLVKDRVFELIHRARLIDGGGDTLITRAGLIAWLDMVKARDDAGRAATLKASILASCNGERVGAWTGVTMEALAK